MLCAVASQPLVSSSTTSNDLDDDADGRGYSNQIIIIFFNIMYFAVRVRARTSIHFSRSRKVYNAG